MFSSNRFHEKPHKQDASADAHTGFLGNHLTLKLFKKDFHLDLFLKNLRNFHLLLKIKIKIQFSRIKVLLLYASEQIKSKKKNIFIYCFARNSTFRQLYFMHFCWCRVPCTTFLFCLKDKENSLFVPLTFLPFELKETSCQAFFLKLSLFSN